MPSPPSRRRTLHALGSLVGVGLAGCLDAAPDAPQRTDPGPTATSTATEQPTASTATPQQDVHVGVRNVAEETYRAEIEIADVSGNETLFADSFRVNGGVSSLVQGAGTHVSSPGTYGVTVRLESGEEASYEWRLEGALGDLTVVITSGGGIEFTQRVPCSPACEPVSTGGSAADIPYAVPGAEETFSRGAVDVENDSDEAVSLTVELRHGGETFFGHTYEVTPDREISIDGVTATAGTFDVLATTADGERAEYTWEIPPEYGWPRLTIRIRPDRTLRIGCGPGGPIGVRVQNEAERARTLSFRLRRGGSTVDETTRTVEPDADTSAEVTPPIGGRYELTVEAESGGAAESAVRFCYCLTESVVVLVGDDDLRLRREGRVCE